MAEIDVISEILNPLNDWFSGKINKQQAKFYILALKGYDSESLKNGFIHLVGNWTKSAPPQPADVRAACDQFITPSKTMSYSEKRDIEFEDLERNIFLTPNGKKAILEGVALDFLQACKGGKRCASFIDSDFVKMKESKRKAAELASRLNPRDTLDKVTLRLWQSMHDYELELRKKYQFSDNISSIGIYQ